VQKPLLKVSASQVENFVRCPRIWYSGHILGDREPQKPHQAKGEQVHAELEHYGKTGEARPSEYLEIVQVALDHLGEHKHVRDPYWGQFKGQAGLLLEQEILMPTYEGGPSWIGYIDRVVAMPDKGEVWDYKTTSDFRYAKTPEELLESIQMQSYAHWLFQNSDYKEVLVKHLCLRMRGRAAAKPVEAVTTRERTESFWRDRILPLVRQMAEWANLHPQTADLLPPHTDHCNDYGGCFYRPKCGFTTTGTRSFEKMAENDLLKQMLAQAGAVGVTVPVASAPTQSANALLASLQTTQTVPTPTQAAPLIPTPTQAAPLIPTPTKAATLSASAATQATPAPMDLNALLGMAVPPSAEMPVKITPDTFPPLPASSILPPDATSRVSTLEEVGSPPAETAPAAPPVPSTSSPEASATAEPAKKRGRPKKSAEAPAVLPGQMTLLESVPITDPAPTHSPEASTALDLAVVAAPLATVPEAPSLVADTAKLMAPDGAFRCGVEVLFVDCLPQKGWPETDKPVHLDDMMHSFSRLAAASAKQPDYGLIPYQGKAYLRTAMRILMHALPKVVIVSTATAGSAEFLEVVTPYAKLIVRGTR
jgi:RecB family exonuclease